uniref:Serine/threonine-protein phosphatase 4 regulatory subunit 2 n=1 Tax=Meloidogyne hapla TaxID=6305 RepID=A0A1I8B7L4_MELHA
MAVQATVQPSSSNSTVSTSKEKQFHSVEEYRRALENFEAPKPEGEINSTDEEIGRSDNPLIDEFFELIANTGRPHLPWELIRNAFIWKLQAVMDGMHIIEAGQQKDDHKKEELINDKEIADLKHFIMGKAKDFDGTPFTIQRLCELLIEPNKHYNRTGVFLRALEKNINVMTTITEDGLRITGADDETAIGMEDDVPIPVECNFIVSVDEMDEPLTKKMAKQSQNGAKVDCITINKPIMTTTIVQEPKQNQKNNGEDEEQSSVVGTSNIKEEETTTNSNDEDKEKEHQAKIKTKLEENT